MAWCAGWVLYWLAMRRPGRGSILVEARRLSIVIPARDEEQNLPVILDSIAAQAVRPREVIVVDDGSTDQTAEIARRSGAVLIPSAPLPQGWRGKPWACQQGADLASGEWLLFLDADTRLTEGALESILRVCGPGAVSIAPHHRVERLDEQLSAFFNLVMVMGTAPRGLFGQMLLIDRQSYDRVGGHAAVAQHTLENLHLSRLLQHRGIPTRSFVGKGSLTMRMYPGGLHDLIEGWTKGFASGSASIRPVVTVLIIVWISGLVVAPILCFRAPWGAIGYVMLAVQLGVILRRVGTFRGSVSALYPVALLFFFILFAWSLFRRGGQVTWKGRTILAD